MKLPLISIVTPSFNQAKYIRATIDSVLSQDYPNFEYLVIDGGSNDGTVEILKSYGKKIKWISEKDAGQTDAINKGMRLTKGEVMAYLNSDDVYMPGALRPVGEYYAKHRGDWITGDCIVIDEHGRPNPGGWLVRSYKRLLMFIFTPLTLKIADNMIPQPSTFWSRRAWEKIGEFNPKYHYVMDYDYWLRLSQYFKPHDLKFVLSGFRPQPESKSETSRGLLMAEAEVALVEHEAKSWQVILHRAHSWVVRLVYNLLNHA